MSAPTADTAFVYSRTFNAPITIVWQALSQLEHLQKWWGPKGCTIPKATLEFRPGGAFHFCMEMPGNHKMWAKFTYREIIEPEQIVYVSSFADEAGNIMRAPFEDTWPLYVLNTITLHTLNAQQTQIRVSGTPIDASATEVATFVDHFSSMEQGFGATFDKLVDYLNTSNKG